MEFKSEIIKEDTYEIVDSKYVDWDIFRDKTIFVTGATGLIGTQIVLSFLLANEKLGLNVKIVALARNKEKCENIFGSYNSVNLKFLIQDINKPIDYLDRVDFIIHTANTTSSKSFVETPVETIETIINGTTNVLKFAREKEVEGLVYLSSMEVYGQVDFDRQEPLKENDYGYIDVLNERSSYPEAKRMAELMCYSYAKEYGLPVKIARLVQTIGAGVDYYDNRVFAQFARNVIEKKDIVLKTTGESVRSYCYITDAIIGILAILTRGQNAECYNVANTETTCSIKEMAEMLSKKYSTSKVVFDIDEKNNDGYLPIIKTILDASKLKSLSWNAQVCLIEMFEKLISNGVE